MDGSENDRHSCDENDDDEADDEADDVKESLTLELATAVAMTALEETISTGG